MVASTNELKEYILKNIEKGYSVNSLKVALLKQGYSRTSIERAIEKIENENKNNKETIENEKPKIKYTLFDENNKVVKIEHFPKKSFLKRIFKR